MLYKNKTKSVGQREEGMDEEGQKAPLPLPSHGQKSILKALGGPADLRKLLLVALEGGRVSLDLPSASPWEPWCLLLLPGQGQLGRWP